MTIKMLVALIKKWIRHPHAEYRRFIFRKFHARRPKHDLTCDCKEGRFIFPSNSVLAESIFVGSGFEDAERNFLNRVTRPGMTVLDVGANIGLYSVLFGRAVGPSGRVWCFEPYGPVASYCKKNLVLNGLSAECLVGKAVSDQEGVVDFFVFEDGLDVYNSTGAAYRPAEALHSTKKVSVPCVTLDSFVAAAGICNVDILKIDVEGADEKVLNGAQGLLANSRSLVIMVEMYEPTAKQCSCSVARLASNLEKHGYVLHTLADNGMLRKAAVHELHNYTGVFCRVS